MDSQSMCKKVLHELLAEPVVLGHTRKATKGSASIGNCHPFDVGEVVGMHNGIVFNHDELNKEYSRKCDVDSEHFFLHLKEDLELHDIESYGAITYYDRRQPTVDVFMSVFNDGELAIANIPDAGFVWSSSWGHLETALVLSGIGNRDHVELVDEDQVLGIMDNDLFQFGKCSVARPRWKLTPDVFRSTGTGIPTHLTDDDYNMDNF